MRAIKKTIQKLIRILPWRFFLRVLPARKEIVIWPPLDKKIWFQPISYGLLWIIACQGKVNRSVYKNTRYRIDDKQYQMKLDISKAPECGYYYKDPTPAVTKLIRRKGHTLLDIGANVGFHSLSASHFFQNIYAFEPTPDTFSRLTQNIQLNEFKNVHAVNLALSSETGTAQLYTSDKNCGNNSLNENEINPNIDYKAITIETQTLDDFVSKQSIQEISLIKIDVEGLEPEVIKGGLRTIKQQNPIILCEVLNNAIAKRVRSILPESYQAWNPRTERIFNEADYNNTKNRPRDVIFSPRNPFHDN